MTASVAVVYIVLMNVLVCGCAGTMKIGAIFDTADAQKERAFELAVERLGKLSKKNYKIEAVIERLDVDDPLAAMSATCSLMKQGVAGILGPTLEHNSRTVQSICDDKDVPHLDLFIDIIRAWEYKDFVVLYDNAESLKRMTRFLQVYNNNNYKIVFRQLEKYGNYRPALKEVRKSGATHLMLDCSTEIVKDVLTQAQQVGLMSDKHYFFITNFDLQTIDLVPFQFSETNITGIRLFDPQSEPIRDLAEFIFAEDIARDPMFVFSAPYKLHLDVILIVDAVMMFGEVLEELPETPKSIDCDQNDRWLSGLTITNLVKGKQYSGLSGIIAFDGVGYRNNLMVDVIELKEGGITKVGNWSDEKSIQKLTIDRPPYENDVRKQALKHKSFRVLISLIEPFARYKRVSDTSLRGNSEYEGFAIDLIHELSVIEGFNYTFLNQIDKKNGDYNPVKREWEGMIGAIRANEADLAIADLTITSDRQQAVDFTTPFMNLGISILYQKPRKAPPSFFSFADPFALEIWILVALSYLTVSMVLFVLGRICSSEWTNPYPCIEEPEYLVNQLSLRNCFWFVSGSIMQQGTEIGPLALSTRMVAGIWWFFTLIMVSSYTANLAVFLTRETPIPHFNDVFELVKNAETKGIKWGAKKDGSTVNFFKASRNRFKEYGQIYDFMMDHAGDVLVSDPTLGVERAERENYAFFMEITSIEYEIQRRCNLTKVGKLLDEKSYGIAMRKNSTYRSVLSRAILDLQHSGKLNELKRKWWEEKRGGGFCESEDDQSEATALNLKNVGGVFWVTMGGVLIAVVLVVAELLMHVVKISIQTKAPLWQSIVEEFKFYFKFSGMIKPVTYNNPNLEESSKSSVKNS
ncbi:glutamate receptor ionotropic, kainate 2-like isoform X2 [Tenebrio molitor]|uniref:glutamate receptor ionotropic, kainate 2-like isoform X2 n=1 Tax=Tenebrio molitor TaxID=7067 RepID=UPI00362491C2